MLLSQLSEHKFDHTASSCGRTFSIFIPTCLCVIETKKDEDDWKNVLSQLEQLSRDSVADGSGWRWAVIIRVWL
jgi:hypothetical protein